MWLLSSIRIEPIIILIAISNLFLKIQEYAYMDGFPKSDHILGLK